MVPKAGGSSPLSHPLRCERAHARPRRSSASTCATTCCSGPSTDARIVPSGSTRSAGSPCARPARRARRARSRDRAGRADGSPCSSRHAAELLAETAESPRRAPPRRARSRCRRAVASSGTTMRLPTVASSRAADSRIATDVVLDVMPLVRGAALGRARRPSARRGAAARRRRRGPATCVHGPMPSSTSTIGELLGRRRPGDDVDAGQQRARERGAALDVTVDRAHADELGVADCGRAPQRDGVVGIVTDVGVDPEPHQCVRRIASSAGSSTGYRNAKPVASSCGRLHALAREQQRLDELGAEAQLQRRASASARTVGRCSTRPSVCANSAFVTGFGATRLTGPRSAFVVDRGADRARPRRRARSSSSTACPSPACRRARA